jgi:hypothetical protein
VKTDTFTSSTTAALTDITGLSGSISLGSAANLVRATPRVQGQTSNAGDAAGFALIRGSTNIGGGVAASARVSAFAGFQRTTDGNSNAGATAVIYDAPGTVASTTYKIQFILQSNSIYINRTFSDTDAGGICRFSSSLTLEEIMA